MFMGDAADVGTVKNTGSISERDGFVGGVVMIAIEVGASVREEYPSVVVVKGLEFVARDTRA